jgi:hypothetical protein
MKRIGEKKHSSLSIVTKKKKSFMGFAPRVNHVDFVFVHETVTTFLLLLLLQLVQLFLRVDDILRLELRLRRLMMNRNNFLLDLVLGIVGKVPHGLLAHSVTRLDGHEATERHLPAHDNFRNCRQTSGQRRSGSRSLNWRKTISWRNRSVGQNL